MKYIRKPPVVEAIQYDGTNPDEMAAFVNGHYLYQADDRVDLLINYDIKRILKGSFLVRKENGKYKVYESDEFKKRYALVGE